MTAKRLDDLIAYWRTVESDGDTQIAAVIRDTIAALEELKWFRFEDRQPQE